MDLKISLQIQMHTIIASSTLSTTSRVHSNRPYSNFNDSAAGGPNFNMDLKGNYFD
jgi:hypothetical protein